MKVSVSKFDFKSDKILSSLSSTERKVFEQSCEELTFKKNKLIFYEMGIPTGVFLLASGRVKIFKTGLDGKDQIFYIYNAGDLMGYHALLCDEHYEDSCEALENCTVKFISRANFTRLLVKIPKLNQLLIQNMSHEFGVLVNIITVLAQKPLRERLALYVLILREKYKDQEGRISLPREDLANIIGTARESLGRLLKEFTVEGLIEIKNKDIIAKDLDNLLTIASSQYK